MYWFIHPYDCHLSCKVRRTTIVPVFLSGCPDHRGRSDHGSGALSLLACTLDCGAVCTSSPTRYVCYDSQLVMQTELLPSGSPQTHVCVRSLQTRHWQTERTTQQGQYQHLFAEIGELPQDFAARYGARPAVVVGADDFGCGRPWHT